MITIMKLKKNILGFAMAAVALSACNMDYNEYTAYDKEYIERSFAYVGGLMTTIYTNIDRLGQPLGSHAFIGYRRVGV